MSPGASIDSLLFEGFRLEPTGLFQVDEAGVMSPVSLGSRAFDLLHVLVQRQGEIVSKDVIMNAVWPGLAIEEGNLTVQISALRRALDQGRSQGSCIQTIPGRGYRFVAPVVRADVATEIAALEPALPDKPSIAVLPFANMSGDPEQEYFADGVVEEIITALSRIAWLFVIARNSSFIYKGQNVDIKRVGRELGVRYVLEGSVRRSARRVRITAQLIDATTGAHLWADRFDGRLEDVFELEDKVAIAAAGIIEPTLEVAEIHRSMARRTTDLTTYDIYLRALSLVWGWNREGVTAGMEILARAIARDPQYAPVLALSAAAHTNLHVNDWTDDPAATRETAVDHARRALACHDDDPNVLGFVARTFGYFGEDIGAAIALIDRALVLNPSFARGWVSRGWLRLWAGLPEPAIEDFETSLRLSPHVRAADRLMGLGVAYFFARRLDEAEAMLLRSLQGYPKWPPTYRFLAAAHAHRGQLDEARRVIGTLKTLTDVLIPPAHHWRRAEDREFYVAGLRLAIGDPEPPAEQG
ncbi:MAG TPA: winged helix-turn-helix domain-containing tetratricopeptide repeat protein [Stellaceae bacterium]|jgi:adenylate cyclase